MTGAPDMESLIFRPTEIRDIPSLYEVRAATRQNAISKAQLIEWGITPESTAQGLESQVLCGMVCEAGGKVVGFCSGDTAAGEVLVLAVLPDYEGMRIGITLLEGVVEQLRSRNLSSLWLACSPDPQSRSHGFYRANGWVPDGQKLDNGDEILRFQVPATTPRHPRIGGWDGLRTS